MDEQLTISTPEQVAFEYEVAGIGSRFVAALVDHLILGLMLVLIVCGASTLGTASLIASSADGGATYYLLLAILTLVIFLVLWGYFVLFETLWNGQTPGKRASRLRVIRRNGQPIGAGEAIIRNLVRLVDFLPGFYGIGFLIMFADKEARRLGDFAAGTIVVREGEQTQLHDVRVAAPPYATQPAYSAYNTYNAPNAPQPAYSPAAPYGSPYGTGYQAQRQQPAMPTSPDPLPGISIRELTHQDYALMRELVARVQRGELPPDRGQELASRMAYGVAERIGQHFAQWQAQGWQPVVFLQSVLEAHDVRGE